MKTKDEILKAARTTASMAWIYGLRGDTEHATGMSAASKMLAWAAGMDGDLQTDDMLAACELTISQFSSDARKN